MALSWVADIDAPFKQVQAFQLTGLNLVSRSGGPMMHKFLSFTCDRYEQCMQPILEFLSGTTRLLSHKIGSR